MQSCNLYCSYARLLWWPTRWRKTSVASCVPPENGNELKEKIDRVGSYREVDESCVIFSMTCIVMYEQWIAMYHRIERQPSKTTISHRGLTSIINSVAFLTSKWNLEWNKLMTKCKSPDMIPIHEIPFTLISPSPQAASEMSIFELHWAKAAAAMWR